VMTALGDILAGGGAPPGQKIRMLNRQGQVRWVEVLAARTTYNSRPAVQVSYMDITGRCEAEAALRESESRFRTLMENAPVAIGISRPGEADYRNRAHVQMFGYEDAGELAGRSFSDQIAPRFRKEATERVLRRKRGLPAETEFESVGLRKDGTEFPFRAAFTVLDLGDGPASVAFITDITAQKDYEQKLGDSHLKLRNLATHLLSAREAERKSVAREIHDELGQLLTALKMDLRWIEKRLGSFSHGVPEKIKGTLDLVDQTIDIVHRISSNLRPVMLDDLGLPAAIEWLGGEFSRRTGISCVTEVTLHESRIGGNSATALFRIVQESLSNVGRHSRASHTSILLRESNGRLEIIVQDDGIGITAEQAAASTSFGLIGLRERIEGLNGEMTVRGQKGKGTTVHITIPLPTAGGLA
jgi:PAS domain S-box-containing protein